MDYYVQTRGRQKAARPTNFHSGARWALRDSARAQPDFKIMFLFKLKNKFVVKKL